MVYQTTCEQSKAQFSLTSGGPRVSSGTPDYAEPGKRRSRSQNPDDLVLIPVFSSKWTEKWFVPLSQEKKKDVFYGWSGIWEFKWTGIGDDTIRNGWVIRGWMIKGTPGE
jgi:hypothetical protein